MTQGGKGSPWQPEWTRFADERTGVHVTQLTAHASVNHHFYFLNPTSTRAGDLAFFTSYRTGRPNLFRVSLTQGGITQLTARDDLHAFAGALHPDGGRLFFTASGAVWVLDLETLAEERLAAVPGGELSECSLSGDGSLLVTTVKHGDHYHLAVVETATGKLELEVHHEGTLVHAQFHPRDNRYIEYAASPAPRMRLLDRESGESQILYDHPRSEWITHETFLDDDTIIFVNWPYRLRRLAWRTGRVGTIAEFNSWHVSPHPSGRYIACDTVHPDIGIRIIDADTGDHEPLVYPESSSQGSQWTETTPATADAWRQAAASKEEAEGALSWMELEADPVYGPQWTHPHPSFSPDGSRLFYTSDRTGHPQVYMVEVPPLET